MIKGSQSLLRLDQLHPDLKRVIQRTAQSRDLIIIEGHRGEKRQNELFYQGKSKLKWPDGKHNAFPSDAVDIAPYPLDWNDTASFHKLAVDVLKAAVLEGVPIRWGGDWDGDGDTKDQKFNDLVHFERKTA
jgi:peptidoglycan L-alanyl-D-glutamate endopeptidase CwlK